MATGGETTWKTVWITGASSGIGLELATLLSRHANHVAISARSADKLSELAQQNKTLSAHPLDVTDSKAAQDVVEDILGSMGPIDLAVLNAAAWKLVELTDGDLAAIRSGIEVNYMGVIHSLNAVLPSMLERGQGHIAIVASTAGYRGLPRSGAYGPTKAALINLAETLNIELAPKGITVSLICPGFVDTPATRTNPFPMPGMITAPQAAHAIIHGLKRRKYDISFPTIFVFFMKLLRILPNNIYFWLIKTFVWKDQDPPNQN